MAASKLLTVAVAVALLISGVAAAGATPVDVTNDDDDHPGEEPPVDVPDDTTQDVPVDNGGDDASDNRPADAGENASDRSQEVGPSDGLPEQVPDHVSQIHEAITSFLNGSISNLGEALSAILGGDQAADDAGDDADDEESEADDGDDSEESEADDEDDDAEDEDDEDDTGDNESSQE